MRTPSAKRNEPTGDVGLKDKKSFDPLKGEGNGEASKKACKKKRTKDQVARIGEIKLTVRPSPGNCGSGTREVSFGKPPRD